MVVIRTWRMYCGLLVHVLKELLLAPPGQPSPSKRKPNWAGLGAAGDRSHPADKTAQPKFPPRGITQLHSESLASPSFATERVYS
eukprot:6969056-Prorocentrum_lima.AAC.1